MALPNYIRQRLNKVAQTMETEAATWADGFTVTKANGGPETPQWRKEYEWAQIRYMRLMSGATFLRQLAKRKK